VYRIKDYIIYYLSNFKRNSFKPLILFILFIIFISISLVGWQIVGHWQNNLALKRLVDKRGNKEIPFLLKSYFYHIPKDILDKTNYDISRSKLPVYELFVSNTSLSSLNKDLPLSGKKYVKAYLKHNNKTQKIKVKYRGDFWFHWATQQKSWRLKLKIGKQIDTMRYINLINPGNFIIADHLVFMIADEFGIIHPKSEMVQFRLNNKNYGVMLLCEQVNEYLLRRNNLLPGNIYAGEGIYMNLATLTNYNDNTNIWKTGNNWEKVANKNSEEKENKEDINKLVNIFNKTNINDFNNSVWNYIDRKHFIKNHALSIVSASTHTDDLHNWKFYINPATGLAITIPWDYGFGNTENANIKPSLMRYGFSALHCHALTNTEYRTDLAKFIYKFLNDYGTEKVLNFIDNENDKIRLNVYADKLKDIPIVIGNVPQTNEFFENGIKLAKNNILILYNNLWNDINNDNINIKKNNHKNENEIIISHNLFGGVYVKSISIKTNKPATGYIYFKTQLGNDSIKFKAEENKNLKIKLSHKLICKTIDTYSSNKYEATFKDIIEPSKFIYKIKLNNEAKLETFDFDMFNVITNNKIDVKNINKYRKLPFSNKYKKSNFKKITIEKQKININKAIEANIYKDVIKKETEIIFSGRVVIKKDSVFNKNTHLIIKPNTTILLDKSCSILIRGQLTAKGTKKNPITIKGLNNEPWGVIALSRTGNKKNNLENCNIYGGNEKNINGIHFSGMLSAYDANISIENCYIHDNFGEDAVNIKQSDFVINNCILENSKFDAIDIDLSNGKINNVLISKSGNDGIDFGIASNTYLKNVFIFDSKDKAISIGERSKVFMKMCIASKSKYGIAVKDEAYLFMDKCNVKNNKIGLASYWKNIKYSKAGNCKITNSNFYKNKKSFHLEINTIANIENCFSDKNIGIENILYTKSNKKKISKKYKKKITLNSNRKIKLKDTIIEFKPEIKDIFYNLNHLCKTLSIDMN